MLGGRDHLEQTPSCGDVDLCKAARFERPCRISVEDKDHGPRLPAIRRGIRQSHSHEPAARRLESSARRWTAWEGWATEGPQEPPSVRHHEGRLFRDSVLALNDRLIDSPGQRNGLRTTRRDLDPGRHGSQELDGQGPGDPAGPGIIANLTAKQLDGGPRLGPAGRRVPLEGLGLQRARTPPYGQGHRERGCPSPGHGRIIVTYSSFPTGNRNPDPNTQASSRTSAGTPFPLFPTVAFLASPHGRRNIRTSR